MVRAILKEKLNSNELAKDFADAMKNAAKNEIYKAIGKTVIKGAKAVIFKVV